MLPPGPAQVREFIPSAGFVPTDIAGLQAWLDFSDITKLFTDAGKVTPVSSDGDPIGAVEDKSGQGNDFIQSTGAKKPTYKTGIQAGLSIARFDGGDLLEGDTLAAAFSGSDQPITVFMGFKQANNSGTQQLFGFANAAFSNMLFSIDASGSAVYRFIRRDDGGSIKLQSAGTPDTSAHLLSAEFSGTVATVRIDTVLIGVDGFDMDVGNIALDKATLGARSSVGAESVFLVGDAFFLLSYDSDLSDADRALVETWANDTWGI